MTTDSNYKLSDKSVAFLMNAGDPGEWIEFFFELQSELIGYGHLEGMGVESLQNFAIKFSALRQFFSRLD